ncbi:MAG: SseB family protein [Kiritimatiellae bacterium]|nr:SseB family protein [Kiritimatiellia bacterium]
MSEVKESGECASVNAAYEAYCSAVSDEGYIRILKAMESALRDGKYAYLPVNMELLEDSLDKGKIAWNVRKTPRGPLLSVFTSEEHVKRHKSPSFMVVKLDAFFEMALENGEFAGMLLNPCDDNGGVVVPRNLVEMVAAHAGVYTPPPRLDMDLVSEALFSLHGNCRGVPFPVMTVNDELSALGGPESFVASILGWVAGEKGGRLWADDVPLRRQLEDILESVLEVSVTSGWKVNEDREFFKSTSPLDWYVKTSGGESFDSTIAFDCCISGMEDYDDDDWYDDIVFNVGTYLDILEAKVGLAFKCADAEEAYAIMSQNMLDVAFGIALFGIGWGVALSCKGQGEDAVQRMEALQDKYLDEGYPGATEE